MITLPLYTLKMIFRRKRRPRPYFPFIFFTVKKIERYLAFIRAKGISIYTSLMLLLASERPPLCDAAAESSSKAPPGNSVRMKARLSFGMLHVLQGQYPGRSYYFLKMRDISYRPHFRPIATHDCEESQEDIYFSPFIKRSGASTPPDDDDGRSFVTAYTALLLFLDYDDAMLISFMSRKMPSTATLICLFRPGIQDDAGDIEKYFFYGRTSL